MLTAYLKLLGGSNPATACTRPCSSRLRNLMPVRFAGFRTWRPTGRSYERRKGIMILAPVVSPQAGSFRPKQSLHSSRLSSAYVFDSVILTQDLPQLGVYRETLSTSDQRRTFAAQTKYSDRVFRRHRTCTAAPRNGGRIARLPWDNSPPRVLDTRPMNGPPRFCTVATVANKPSRKIRERTEAGRCIFCHAYRARAGSAACDYIQLGTEHKQTDELLTYSPEPLRKCSPRSLIVSAAPAK